MRLRFSKMNGAGNDFILLDNRQKTIELSREQVVRICNRQRGVGADGLLLLVPCETGAADFAWAFYNSDGSTADMCGNGARCFARYVQRVTHRKGNFSFETGAGVINASFVEDLVTINLTAPTGLALNQNVKVADGSELAVHSLNTGVPHAVVYVTSADEAMVSTLGRELRNHSQFGPKGTNVNFVHLLAPNSIRVRTYERGVEGETLACGTGVTAAALITARLHEMAGPIKVLVQGGDLLEVSFVPLGEEFTEVRLTGPADFVFFGEIDL